jgi:transcriptional regulator with XRE-family HTH domain
VNKPSPAGLRLAGAILRRHREALKLTITDAARIVELDASAISRIETGQRGIRPAYLRILMEEYAIPESTRATLAALTRRGAASGWQAAYHGILPAPWLDYLAAENAAAEILTYAPVHVPGLLQSPRYARALALGDPQIRPEHKLPAADAALLRQETTLGKRAIPLTAIIGEAAIRHAAADRALLAEQTDCLARAAASPGVTVRFLPFTAGPVAAAAGEFTILRFGDPAEFAMIHLAGPGGGTILDGPAAITAYQDAFTRLHGLSLPPGETSRRLQAPAGAIPAA